MPNNTTKEVIIALRPGRREIGIAVLDGRDLVHWAVAGFRAYRGDELLCAVEARLQKLLAAHQPRVLAMEKPSAARISTSPALSMVMGRVCAVAVREGLGVRLCSPGRVRLLLCGQPGAAHDQVVGRVVAMYPHLARYQRSCRAWQEDYWRPMFTAVAVALAAGTVYPPA